MGRVLDFRYTVARLNFVAGRLHGDEHRKALFFPELQGATDNSLQGRKPDLPGFLAPGFAKTTHAHLGSGNGGA